MCSRFQLDDNAEVRTMLDRLGVRAAPLFQPDITPMMPISLIRQDESGKRELVTATWWLCLDRVTLQPIRQYASSHTRCDRLSAARSLAYRPFRTSRCVIPASAFIAKSGDESILHRIELQGSAIAFGGLFQDYRNSLTGEVATGASIITLPPVPGWEEVHPASLPLMLNYRDRHLMESWLDRHDYNVEQFEPLLTPKLRHTERVTRMGEESSWNPIAPTFTIPAERGNRQPGSR